MHQDSIQVQSVADNGVFEREDLPDDIREFSHQRYKFGTRHFWCTGYFVSTVGVNKATIIKYVREQEERGKITDQ